MKNIKPEKELVRPLTNREYGMTNNDQIDSDAIAEEEVDEIADFVATEKITAVYERIDFRPDVLLEEQEEWRLQDPEFPPEHYHCVLKRGNKALEVYQSVAADYPDEDEDADNIDLYRDNRELMLSAEFLIESAALKANSIDESTSLFDWVEFAYCESLTPQATYEQYRVLRENLRDFLGDDDLYKTLVQCAVKLEMERDEESEDT
jgi:hypothetical protein